ncbi:hypothetical protein Aph02nite_15330 [Actinoplanes philippinensis]|uniref:Uncharacterized protein n=1 Tax=Actinoplanes philippinensis TaxID=35752 RepID=A0A1I1ZB17_9ACTN|nr:hypothetical protein [Actinoplanes philippinensis]GIE75583.1 hypothetical protein Aph02nite_15330 [Actinoplanes philippinensis]SFE28879.1 hypothetical protein SAMN05421541_1014 [Actinoplanes philippinensis]
MIFERAAQAALGRFWLATVAYSVTQSPVVPAAGVFQRERGTTPSGAAFPLSAFPLSAPVLGRLAGTHGKRRILLVP